MSYVMLASTAHDRM